MEFFEIVKRPSIDFMRQKKKAFVLSGIFVLLGLVAFSMIIVGRANMSVDFTGGIHVQVRFSKPVTIEDLRTVFSKDLGLRAQVQEVGTQRDFFIKVKLEDIDPEKANEKIARILSESYSEKDFEILGVNLVGPTVGKELKKNAIIAVIVAVICIIIYIAWRFTFIFGVAATIATFHDVLAVLGIFYLLGKEINILLITALLTIAGYSLTDTIVVFDRIRENLSKIGTKMDFQSLINKSINEVLSRTLITSITTLLAILAILILGGAVLFDFSLALFLGVIVGTYSSIFVASPLVYVWRKNVR